MAPEGEPCFPTFAADVRFSNRLCRRRDRVNRLFAACIYLLLAQSGHSATEFQCLLLGVKRTLILSAAMSAFDPKRT